MILYNKYRFFLHTQILTAKSSNFRLLLNHISGMMILIMSEHILPQSTIKT